MSIHRGMDTEIVVHMYNGILLSYKKEHIQVSPNEVDESKVYYVPWSEVSQKEKDKYCILMNAYGIEKDGIDEPICSAATETQT